MVEQFFSRASLPVLFIEALKYQFWTEISLEEYGLK